jgi:hypothetical protein
VGEFRAEPRRFAWRRLLRRLRGGERRRIGCLGDGCCLRRGELRGEIRDLRLQRVARPRHVVELRLHPAERILRGAEIDRRLAELIAQPILDRLRVRAGGEQQQRGGEDRAGGATNAKGYILGGNLGIGRNTSDEKFSAVLNTGNAPAVRNVPKWSLIG